MVFYPPLRPFIRQAEKRNLLESLSNYDYENTNLQRSWQYCKRLSIHCTSCKYFAQDYKID